MGVLLLDVVALLANLCGLAAKLAQVIKLGASDVSTRNKLNLLKNWGVNRPGALYANLEGNFTNCEGLTDSVAGATNYDSLEKLNTAAATLNDVYVNLDGVTGSEVWNVVPKALGI
jgi:hypothetical protein